MFSCNFVLQQSVKHLCTVYMDASDDDKLEFFTILAEKYGVDHNQVTSTATNLASCKVKKNYYLNMWKSCLS